MTTLYLGTQPTVYIKFVQDADDETPVTGIASQDIDLFVITAGAVVTVNTSVNEIGRGWYEAVLDLDLGSQGFVAQPGPLVVEAQAPGTNIWSFVYNVVESTLTEVDAAILARYLMTVSLSSISSNATLAQQSERNLLNFIRSGLGQNRLSIPTMSGAAIGYREDDTTAARTYTITTDAAGAPISQIDPV